MQELSAVFRVMDELARDALAELRDNISECQIASKEKLNSLTGPEVLHSEEGGLFPESGSRANGVSEVSLGQ